MRSAARSPPPAWRRRVSTWTWPRDAYFSESSSRIEVTRAPLDGIDVSTLVGLRDRAFPGVLVYSDARVSAAVSPPIKSAYTGTVPGFRLTP